MGCTASTQRESLKEWRKNPLLEQYRLHKRLGSGAFSEVHKATHLSTKQVRALKVVFWQDPTIQEQHKNILRKEVDLLYELSHSNIVKLIEHHEDDASLVLALELLQGGGLLEHLLEVEHYDEAQAAQLFAQLLSAVEYMHSLNIMHRDIKPENVVFAVPPSQGMEVKLVDFGLARKYSDTRSVKARLGSPGFMSPETIRGERHTLAMDMFSMGVLLFVMLTGNKPMRRDEAKSLAYHSMEAHEYYRLAHPSWNCLSQAARSLVLQMLERNPFRRISASDALKHEWIVSRGGECAVPLPRVPKDAHKLGHERKFRGLANAVIAMNRFSRLGSSAEVAGDELVQEIVSRHAGNARRVHAGQPFDCTIQPWP